MGVPWWRPKNDVERGMLAALKRADTQEYLRLVGTTDLFVPQLVDDGDGDGGTELRAPITRELSGVTLVLAFSSPETMAIAVGDEADAYTKTTYPQLRARWPAPQWRLAVNAGSAIAAFPSIAAIDRAVRGEPAGPGEPGERDLPVFDPATARLAALVENDVDEGVEALLGRLVTVATRRQVHRPEDIMDAHWHVAGAPAAPAIEAFTTAEAAATAYPDLPNVRLPFPLLLSLLPERAGLVVDPGGPGETELRGDRLLLAMFRVNDWWPAREVPASPRPPRWHLTAGDPPPLTAQVRGFPPPGAQPSAHSEGPNDDHH
jgi:hypothetical protein